MSLTTTNALITVQDGAAAVQSPAAGAAASFTPGALVTFALASTTGVQRWELTFECPAYPQLHQRTYTWLSGMVNQWQVQMPALPVYGGASGQAGIQIISVVSDGVQSIASTTNYINTRGAPSVPVQHTCKYAIVAALPAYTNTNGVLTGNSNGAITSTMADGQTPAVGDFFLLPPGIAAAGADAGLYVITAVGASGALFSASLIPDWPLAGLLLPKTEVLVTAGTVFGLTTWVVTNTSAATIGTTSLTMYPRTVIQSITLVSGTVTVTNVPVLSATKTAMQFTRTTASGTSSTVSYGPVGTITPGALGTSTFAFDACVAAGTINASDGSTGALAITNPV